ncbi:hypothetical protein C3941_03930 [Kaistia algarum]|uniref:hypothetical protein n=1 Tax=Kaistia algarum TaxID=2083279 RepID=UPI000CE80D6C|nr:hypothetical protein [Kaistia algarum]MCX5512636.1 DUF3329 domain-containing protein [Kaistia algarum]PPE81848.1 hypothetical protein C3941_03930 [Kaistia algarum]
MKNQADQAFFRPLWRRVAVVTMLAVWFAFEALYVREQMWLVIIGGTLAYAVWNFFLNWTDEAPPPPPGQGTS